YRTWSIGVNGGVLTPIGAFGSNDFNEWNAELGYGGFIKKQLAPSFGLKADFHRGKLSADGPSNAGANGFETQIHHAASLKAVVSVGTISFLKREKSLGFFVQTGAGIAGWRSNTETGAFNKLFIPVGAGANVKLGDVVALNLGYDVNFLDADNLDGTWVNGV